MNEALVLLVLVWAALLIPAAIRSRAASPHATVGGFERAMDVLRSQPQTVAGSGAGASGDPAGDRDLAPIASSAPSSAQSSAHMARGEHPVIVQRRTWFIRALAATGVALLLALVAGGWLWYLAGLATVLTAGYTFVLRRLKLQRDAAREVVRELDLTDRDPVLRERVGYGDDALEVEREPVAVGGSAGGAGWHGGSGSVRLRRWDG